MKFAEVVVGLPIDGPFDYSIPENLIGKVKFGSRVSVMFHNRRFSGYVIKIKESSKVDVKKIKSIIDIIDALPIIDKNTFKFAEEFSQYYCCSLGQAIETILPEGVRKTKNVSFSSSSRKINRKSNGSITIVIAAEKKYSYVLELVKKKLSLKQQVLIIVPQLSDIEKWQEALKDHKDNIALLHSYQKHKQQVESWQDITSNNKQVVIGTMSAVFASGFNIGLIVVDEESSFIYKQRQFPFYHVREVVKMRASLDNCDISFIDSVPSLETYALSRKQSSKTIFLDDKKKPNNLKIIDLRDLRRQNLLISPYLEDRMAVMLKENKKTLLFLNRRGHSNIIRCDKCAFIVRCKKCSAALVFDNRTNELSCHFCDSKYPILELCPNCNSRYVKFTGIGIEKIAGRLKMIFPSVRVKMLDREIPYGSLGEFDILVSTSSVFNFKDKLRFDLSSVLSLDEGLDLPDFRNNEITFNMLSKINEMTKEELIIQTRYVNIGYLKFLKDMDVNSFYQEELKERKQLGFPPFNQLVCINMRSKKEEFVAKKAAELYEKLAKLNIAGLELYEPVKDTPYKLRNSYRWQVVMKAKDFVKIRNDVKKIANDYYQSGIITTIDVGM